LSAAFGEVAPIEDGGAFTLVQETGRTRTIKRIRDKTHKLEIFLNTVLPPFINKMQASSTN
jgi:hypothetical protein